MSLISPFQEQAYENATTLKAQSLALIAKSGEPYSSHRESLEKLLVDVDAAYEYADGLPKNEVVSKIALYQTSLSLTLKIITITMNIIMESLFSVSIVEFLRSTTSTYLLLSGN